MINEYIERIRAIRAEIRRQNENYDAYAHAFEEYRVFLEERLAQNPSDVDTVCQLAMVYLELRYDGDTYYDLYRRFLDANQSALNDAEKARIYNNLTALCDQDGVTDGFMEYAPRAISCGSVNAHVYDAYGKNLWELDIDNDYEWCFERACELERNLQFEYNLAVARYYKGKTAEADAMFTALLQSNPDHNRILHAKALCLIRLSVEQYREEIIAIAEKLDQMPKDALADIDELDIASLYFLCGRHSDYRCVVDSSIIRYSNDAYWLAPYFYSMKVRREEEELATFYQEVMEEVDGVISNQEDPEDEAYWIARRQAIVTAYQEVQEGILPTVEPTLYFMWYGCYLDDCPRHGKLAGKSVE